MEEKKEGALEWYFRPWIIALAIIGFGPLGLLLLWYRPRTKMSLKVWISVVVCLLTVWTVMGTVKYYRTMSDYYEEQGRIIDSI